MANGLYGAGNAPDVGWWAYAPLASKAFSPGHSSDYWTISLLVSGFGSVGTAINIIATILCMRCPGMHLGRMPLLAWLNLVMAGMVLIAITPLSAAQIMLLVDRYLGGHFFDTQAGGSATLWMHFFWIFGHPGSLRAGDSRLRVHVRDHSGVLAETHVRLSGHGGGDGRDRVREHERVGAPHVHDRDELLRQQLLRDHHHGRGRSDGHQDLQLARHDVGREDPVQDADAVLHRHSCSSS